MSGPSSNVVDPTTASSFRRKLGGNELFCNLCHSHGGGLNVMCGLTLLTRQAIDEGLMKCALQEFQHRYPQLTSRIRADGGGGGGSGDLHFVPMECPTFPLDTDFECKDMLQTKFDVENGPLWRVQLVTEANMDKAAIGFGPEVSAIIEDDSPASTRWRYFLRYFQGKVNGQNIDNFDEEEEGFRSFILMTFHPSVTDTLGSFHLTKQFLLILDAILEQDGNALATLQGSLQEEESIHSSIESLLPQNDSAMHLGDLFQMAKMAASSYVMPRRSPFENLKPREKGVSDSQKTEMLRGWLTEEQTAELLAMQEEDDASLHGVMLAAGLLAVSRVLLSPYGEGRAPGPGAEFPPGQTLQLRAANGANLRQYCSASSSSSSSHPRHGCLTTSYETDHSVPPITDRAEFWRYAHELTVRHNAAKGSREPLKMLRVYNKMFSMSGSGGGGSAATDSVASAKESAAAKLANDMEVSVYGDLGGLFRREHFSLASEAWSGPASSRNSSGSGSSSSNLRLEDVFHMGASSPSSPSSPLSHSAHLFRGRLNYVLTYGAAHLRQELAFRIRDEVVDILRMATERGQ